MSFSDRIREELWQDPIKSSCCRKAFLFGLLIRADWNEADELHAELPVTRSGTSEVEERVTALFRVQLGCVPSIRQETRGSHRYLTVQFRSHTAVEVLRALAATEQSEVMSGDMAVEETVGFKCESCAPCFLRGAFLAAGSVSDPAHEAHLELRLPMDGRATCLADTCIICGVQPRITSGGGQTRVFIKRLDDIRDMLSRIGCVQPAFDILNRQMYNEARAEEARATNWVAANIRRTVQAGQLQLRAIQRLEADHRLESLPPELQETARLRLQYPEVSLSELAALHEPPITKSGLNHRLRRILEAENA